MNIKNVSKKILVSLLIATTFVPFGLKINDAFQNSFPATFANQTSNVVNHKNVDFVCAYNGIYVEKNIYDQNPNTYNNKAISQVFECANKLVNDKTGLEYNLNLPIYIVDNESTTFLKKRDAAITYSKTDEQCIYIKNKYFFEKDTTTLAHEMVHALLCGMLKENYFDLPLWLNEGIATQADSQNHYGRDFSSKELNKLLKSDNYPENNDENLKYYLIHQRLIKLWIDDQGSSVIRKFINLINNGKNPVDAFSNLGGNKAINKLKNIAVN